MNVDQINRWLKIVGNVGALVGIGLLITELNQNNRMVKTQTRNAITESILNFQFNSATSGLVELSARANAMPDSVTPQEAPRLVQYYVSNFRLWENIHYQYRSGVFDEGEFSAERSSWKALGDRTPLMHAVYCVLRQRQSLSAGFIRELDSLGYGAVGKCDEKLIAVLMPH
jgi:hypothetical protein